MLNLLQEFDSCTQVIVLKEVLDGAEGVIEEGLHGAMLVLDHTGQAVRFVRIDLLPANANCICPKLKSKSIPEDYLVTDKGFGKEHGVLNMDIVISCTVNHQ